MHDRRRRPPNHHIRHPLPPPRPAAPGFPPRVADPLVPYTSHVAAPAIPFGRLNDLEVGGGLLGTPRNAYNNRWMPEVSCSVPCSRCFMRVLTWRNTSHWASPIVTLGVVTLPTFQSQFVDRRGWRTVLGSSYVASANSLTHYQTAGVSHHATALPLCSTRSSHRQGLRHSFLGQAQVPCTGHRPLALYVLEYLPHRQATTTYHRVARSLCLIPVTEMAG